jgi:hypothetical protein
MEKILIRDKHLRSATLPVATKYFNNINGYAVFSKIIFLPGQERKDARLQKQADFINQFREGDIWSNVVIVVKQPGSFNVRQAGLAIKNPPKKTHLKNPLKMFFFVFYENNTNFSL